MQSNSTPKICYNRTCELSYSPDENGCWIPKKKPNPVGYVYFRIDGKQVLAHRYMWEQVNGPIPVGKEMDHLCRNRGCCNPDHLEPVTRAENTHRGVRSSMNADTVLEIRKLSSLGAMATSLAKEFGFSETTINHVIHRRTWKNV